MFTVKKLKISGFKSFAHPTELMIDNGVTGIIGPNGCGKSNVFEAIRWVMGETSSKSLRSGSMDDIIFNGTQNLPAKNVAEVSIELDNFSGNLKNVPDDEKKIIVTRVLERGIGSFFKINNKDVRARDVSVIFYDSGSGPRSSSIISQGNIDQIINFKPIDRRIILEDAAGISGLQARRHESELKLHSTELNLEKLEINLNNLKEQKNNLSRQARQAERYEEISKSIKHYQSMFVFFEWKEIKINLDENLEKIVSHKKYLTDFIENSNQLKTQLYSLRESLEKHQAIDNNLNKKLFETESIINSEKNKLELIENKKTEIRKFLETVINDKKIEYKKLKDLEDYIKYSEEKIKKNIPNKANLNKKLNNLGIEETELKRESKQLESIFVNEIQLTLGDEFKSDNLKETKESLKLKSSNITKDVNIAKENSIKLEKDLKLEQAQQELLIKEKKSLENQIKSLKISIEKNLQKKLKNINQLKLIDLEIEKDSKIFTEADTEIKTLNQLLGNSNLTNESIVNLIKIKPGYEDAIFASLMYELDATLNKKSSKQWVKQKIVNLEAIENPISNFVNGPEELDLILSQIGLVENKNSALNKQKKLKVGQMLVDIEGNLWRWDGFVSSDNLKNKKLIDSQLKINELKKIIKVSETKLTALRKKGASVREENQKTEDIILKENKELEKHYKDLDLINPKISSKNESITFLNYNLSKNKENIDNLLKEKNEILLSQKEIEEKEEILNKNYDGKSQGERHKIESKIQELDKKTENKRIEINSIKELIIKEELNMRYLLNDIQKSKTNSAESKKRIAMLEKREKEYLYEDEKLNTLPSDIQNKINNFEGEYNKYKNQLKNNKDFLDETIKNSKNLEEKFLKSESIRENKRNEITRIESLIENTKSKEKELRKLIFERSSKQPEDMESEANDKQLKYKTYDDIKNHLQKLTFQREQMGPVNLRAKLEEKELEVSIEELELEKNDLSNALKKLREAISKINHEGKNRVVNAFEKVNKNFGDLFKKLFDGGEAKLELVKSDDPLQTGLEIFARPPGKKLSNISLLSGGEKTLTAISLIFSIFLINPSPICILDEVDAALDDNNIEKFCLILNELKNNTKTKFLIITHNKITMSSIDRVYGVTMAQKGISDIVSVDFEKVDIQEAV